MTFSRAQMGAGFLLFSLLLLQFAYRAEAQGQEPPLNPSSPKQRPAIQNPQEVTTLELGKPVEREISFGQTHSFQITLSGDQFAAVTIKQRGLDVVEQLFTPDGKLIAWFDDEVRPQEEERADLVSSVAGTYRLDVQAKLKNAVGRYEVCLTERRANTESDRLLFAARKLDTEVIGLRGAAKFDEALPLAARALDIAEKQLGSEHPYIGHLLTHQADLYFRKGDFAKARELFGRALVINQKMLGPEHPESVIAMAGLGLALSYLNEYDKAEELLQQAVHITEQTLGSEHPRVARYLTNISNLHLFRGDLARAEQDLQRAITIAEKSLGPDDSLLAEALNNLGQLYNSRKDFARAEPLLQRSLQIDEKTFGRDSYQVAIMLQNLGVIAQEKNKDYGRALDLYWRADRIFERSEGPESPRAARILNNIANIYRSQGEYQKSLELHQRVFSIFKKTIGPYNNITLVAIGNIARTYAVMGDVAMAIEYQARTDEVIEKNLALNLAVGSERQKLAFFDSLAERTDRTIWLHVNLAPNEPAARNLAVLDILQRKGRVLDALSNTFAALRERLNPEDQKLLDELNTTTKKFAALNLNGPGKLPADEFQKQLISLAEQKEDLEAEISRRSAEFRSQSQTVTLATVQAAIPGDAALIEFASYRPFDPKADSSEAYGEPHYIAYVIRHQGEVQWKELGPAKEIDARVAAWRQALRDPARNDAQQLGRAVDEKVMQPVRAVLGDAKLLLISPDSELNLIPFAALVDEERRYLIQGYSLVYLTSGRDLLRLQVARASKSPPVIVADPAFGEPALVDAGKKSETNGGGGPSTRTRIDYSRMFFGPLPGVNDEVRALKTLLPNARFLTKEQATKAALESVVAPAILHIATHGFFISDPGPAGVAIGSSSPTARPGAYTTTTTRNPLLRSGIALAGANHDESGVLTALEASGLNLWGTKLVVLSACDTGLGEIRNGEGVYGLRRALVLAGAETQLMSLWPVSDRATRDLMIGYYQDLVRAQGRGQALRRAQLQMLQNKSRSHPYYWAGFIQTGEWANLEGKR